MNQAVIRARGTCTALRVSRGGAARRAPARRAPIGCGLLGAAVLSLLSPGAFGETAYVIDRLLVGIHQDKELDSAIIKVLPTGTQLEVLERDGDFAKVQTRDGTTGWIDASYIMSEMPAQLVVRDLEAKHRRTVADLETARIEVQMLKTRIADLEKERSDAAGLAGEASSAKLQASEDRVRVLAAELEKRDAAAAALTAEVRSLTAARQRMEAARAAAAQESAREAAAAKQAAQAEIASLKARVAALEGPAAGRADDAPRPADARAIARLEAENGRLEAELSSMRSRNPAPAERRPGPRDAIAFLRDLGVWPLTFLGSALLLAFGVGGFSVSYLVRRRHGGFRF